MKAFVYLCLIATIVTVAAIGSLSAQPNLLTFGINLFGRLGNGQTTQLTTIFANITSSGDLANVPAQDIVEVETGSLHSAVLTKDGRLFMFGKNCNGQTGQPITGSIPLVNVPKLVDPALFGGRKIVRVALGDLFTIVLTEDGKVFEFGRFSLFGGFQSNVVPRMVLFGEEDDCEVVIDIAAGSTHALAIDSKRKVWAWGSNAIGQLGLGSNTTKFENPERVMGDLEGKRARGIAGGATSSVVVTNKNDVFTFGKNIGKVLCIGASNPFSVERSPVQVDVSLFSGERVEKVSLSFATILVSTNKGNVFACGSNSNGQLGNNSTDNDSSTFVQTKGFDITNRGVDLETGDSQNYVVNGEDGIFAFGSSFAGLLGVAETDVRVPQALGQPGSLLDISKVKSVSISNGYVLLLLLPNPQCNTSTCTSSEKCCFNNGIDQCYKKNQFSCQRENVLCKQRDSVCNGVCINDNQFTCYLDSYLCKNRQMACNGQCFDSNKFKCFNNAQLCAKKDKICGTVCYDPNTFACFEGGILGPKDLSFCAIVNGFFDPEVYKCGTNGLEPVGNTD